MKTKLIFLTLLVSMCSNQTQENDDEKEMGAENFTLENVVILKWQMRTTTSQKKKSEGRNKRKHSNEYGDGPSHEENKGDEEEEERISTTHHLEAHSFEIVSPQSEKESESTLLESGTQNENNANVGIIEDSQNGMKKKKKKKADVSTLDNTIRERTACVYGRAS